MNINVCKIVETAEGIANAIPVEFKIGMVCFTGGLLLSALVQSYQEKKFVEDIVNGYSSQVKAINDMVGDISVNIEEKENVS